MRARGPLQEEASTLGATRSRHGAGPQAARRRVTVGILNNMPDTALPSTERQFLRLLKHGSRDVGLEVRFFHLPGIARGQAARAHIVARYHALDDLLQSKIDALIVTGCE